MKSGVTTQPTQDTLVEVKVVESLRETIRLSIVGAVLLGIGAMVLAAIADLDVVKVIAAVLALAMPLVSIASYAAGSLGSRRTTKVPTDEHAPPGELGDAAPAPAGDWPAGMPPVEAFFPPPPPPEQPPPYEGDPPT